MGTLADATRTLADATGTLADATGTLADGRVKIQERTRRMLPYPWLYQHKDEFFALPPRERAPHIWEAVQFLQYFMDHPEEAAAQNSWAITDEILNQQMDLLRRLALDVAKAIGEELREQGAWKNPYDPRWPRFRPHSKDPLYLIGGHPPLGLCLPIDQSGQVETHHAREDRGRFEELADWLRTPAGRCVDPEQTSRMAELAANYKEKCEATDRSRKAYERSKEKVVRAAEEVQRMTKRLKGRG
jgi:X-X-X-Leu-X-X-Gly heptad repeat protein